MVATWYLFVYLYTGAIKAEPHQRPLLLDILSTLLLLWLHLGHRACTQAPAGSGVRTSHGTPALAAVKEAAVIAVIALAVIALMAAVLAAVVLAVAAVLAAAAELTASPEEALGKKAPLLLLSLSHVVVILTFLFFSLQSADFFHSKTRRCQPG